MVVQRKFVRLAAGQTCQVYNPVDICPIKNPHGLNVPFLHTFTQTAQPGPSPGVPVTSE